MARTGGLWPNLEQEKLLKLCLTDKPISLDEYSDWLSLVNVDHLDDASYMLLPLLSARLVQSDLSTKVIKIIKTARLRSWVDNQKRLQNFLNISDQFSQIDIPCIPLKGTALILDGTYPNISDRPSSDLDLLIHPSDVGKAIALLINNGWVQVSPKPERAIDVEQMMDMYHSVDLIRGTREKLDLHWSLYHRFGYEQNLLNYIWDYADRKIIQNQSVLLLSATDQLLHTCSHGMRWASVAPIRWLADAHYIISHRQESIDWDRLLRQTADLGIVMRVHGTFKYLNKNTFKHIPTPVIQKLGEIKVNRLEKVEAFVHQRASGLFNSNIVRLVRIYRLAIDRHGNPISAFANARYYLCCLLGASKNDSVLKYLLKAAVRLIVEVIKRPDRG